MFQKPELEVITFKSEDVIATSTPAWCDGAPTSLGDLYGNSCNFDPDAPDD